MKAIKAIKAIKASKEIKPCSRAHFLSLSKIKKPPAQEKKRKQIKCIKLIVRDPVTGKPVDVRPVGKVKIRVPHTRIVLTYKKKRLICFNLD